MWRSTLFSVRAISSNELTRPSTPQCDIGIGTLPAGDRGIRVRSLATRNALCVMPAASDCYQLDLYFECHGVSRKLGIEGSLASAARRKRQQIAVFGAFRRPVSVAHF
jgi:hypothetical protein